MGKNEGEDATTVAREMFCTMDIHVEDTKTVSFYYRYLTDIYHEERVTMADLPKSFKAVEEMMNRFMPKVCGRLFPTGYLKTIDFTIRELEGDNIIELFYIRKGAVNDSDTRHDFKKVEEELVHFLEAGKKNSHKPS